MLSLPVIAALASTFPAAGIYLAQSEASQGLPDGVRSMIEAAIASREPQAIETVTRFARETHPGAIAEIDEVLAEWRRQQAAVAGQRPEPEAVLAAQQPEQQASGGSQQPDWKGQVEVGGSRSTGRSSYVGAVGAVALEREGPRWDHKTQVRIEVQKGRNVTDVERLIASWQPNYKFGDSLYVYGLGEVESDPAQAYRRRYTASGGLGYTVLSSESAKLDLEGGPAFRYVEESVGAPNSSVAARASFTLRWTVSPTLEIRQASALYVERGNRNANALTSLDAQLIGPLKARLSYDVRYEDRLDLDGSYLDTLSRASLVYSF
jgi:putative salt-induced outer membrane protein